MGDGRVVTRNPYVSVFVFVNIHVIERSFCKLITLLLDQFKVVRFDFEFVSSTIPGTSVDT